MNFTSTQYFETIFNGSYKRFKAEELEYNFFDFEASETPFYLYDKFDLNKFSNVESDDF